MEDRHQNDRHSQFHADDYQDNIQNHNHGQFDILDWHPAYSSCQRYFLDHAQHDQATQSLCALINIRLPFQWRNKPVHAYRVSKKAAPSAVTSPTADRSTAADTIFPDPRLAPSLNTSERDQPLFLPPPAPIFVSLIPYIKRLVVTGFDNPAILHGFFGDDWLSGIGHLHECERRNYLFTARAGGWNACKIQYDMDGKDESVPFMKPLEKVTVSEKAGIEKAWEDWEGTWAWTNKVGKGN